MNSQLSQTLLGPADPPPVRIVNPRGPSPFLLVGDHAGNAVPAALGSLGLTEMDLTRHIAWDIGIAGLGERLAAALDSVFVFQPYSRLVIDCNRDPDALDAIPAQSDGTKVPANYALSSDDRTERVKAIHAPYQAAIAAELARRDAASQNTILVSLHSFTPALGGMTRPWQIGILYSGGDKRFALSTLWRLRAEGDLIVGDNQPYAMDAIDHTVPLHAFDAERPYVEIEIRQDLLATPKDQAAWGAMLVGLLQTAAAGIN